MNQKKTYTVTQAARMLGMGRNNLLKLMRKNGFLYSQEPMRNSPTKWAVEQSLLNQKTGQFFKGPVKVQHITALVTPKGMAWIRDIVESQTTTKAG
ncbi:phage antirepressor KilAC domain-containing protein [Microbulbifer sp. OS29]|uniref:Phage antirepressor KilAC domain-containing protein n=1 Tax=Microbulbifer okhotskensis TaxID=2926617 RepID=A0A9X2J6W2_9GAMM|nr:phage antirepressor KilAC domain-containing protein [Microbulbifer okhotskensis]MCO1336643.1 phage antirepressor KilAC domain-containing protein [Microbulbifer okhotskensis]